MLGLRLVEPGRWCGNLIRHAANQRRCSSRPLVRRQPIPRCLTTPKEMKGPLCTPSAAPSARTLLSTLRPLGGIGEELGTGDKEALLVATAAGTNLLHR